MRTRDIVKFSAVLIGVALTEAAAAVAWMTSKGML